jgi:hypothetical protein
VVLLEDSTYVRNPDIRSGIRTLDIHVLLAWAYSMQERRLGRCRPTTRHPAVASIVVARRPAAVCGGSLMFEPASKGPVSLLREAQSQEGPPAVHAPTIAGDHMDPIRRAYHRRAA